MNKLLIVFFCLISLNTIQTTNAQDEKFHSLADTQASRFIQVKAISKEERSAIANLGMSIEWVRSDSVWGFADNETLNLLKQNKFEITGNFDLSTARGGHQDLGSFFGFPNRDARFHDYAELVAALNELQVAHPEMAKTHIIGKTIEGKDIVGLHINSTPEELTTGQSGKPGVFYVGMHHAREHLSSEVPLVFAQYLLKNKADPEVKRLLESRDIWIFPMLNSDGLQYDISATNSYKNWRKNRRNNGNGSFGVDLNRNYGYMWGTGGSSKNTSSDTYMGTKPFSEPETSAIKNFIDSHSNIKVLLSLHTFSELILYPWGHTYDPIANQLDADTFKKMATTMAQWNRYTPQASSDLYIASGDTVDWAYGEHGIFAFTFELSPKSIFEGGFYLGAGSIDRVFKDNLKPMLYLMDSADNPHKVLGTQPTGMLQNYVQPELPLDLFYGGDPLKYIGKNQNN